MYKLMMSTKDDFAITIARLGLGIVMFAHGAQKVLGWFGGYGFSGTMGFFTGTMHIPYIFALLAIIAEFAGSLGLIVGFLSRIAAFGIFINMAVAVFLIHQNNGFFMNWMGTQKGEGFEFHILALTLSIVIMIRGAGSYSIDSKICCSN